MRMTKVEFRKKYQRPEDQIKGQMHEWYQSILHRNHADIMLSEIPFRYIEWDNQSYAYVVTGYNVKMMCRVGDPYAITAYSPLVGGLIGNSYSEYYEVKDLLYNAMASTPLTPEPLDDETSKLILMADCIPSLYATLVNGSPLYKWQFRGNEVGDDMLLNLVSCIRKQEKEKRDRLMRLFDTYGAPKGLLGEALMHIDKFRSM
jgi:hypothetical protein